MNTLGYMAQPPPGPVPPATNRTQHWLSVIDSLDLTEKKAIAVRELVIRESERAHLAGMREAGR